MGVLSLGHQKGHEYGVPVLMLALEMPQDAAVKLFRPFLDKAGHRVLVIGIRMGFSLGQKWAHRCWLHVVAKTCRYIISMAIVGSFHCYGQTS